MRIHYIKRAALSLCAAMSLGLSATSQVSQSVTTAQNAQAEPLTPPYSETFADESFCRKLYNHRQQSRRNKMGALFWEGTNLLQLRIGDGRLVDYPGTEPRRR